MAQASQETVFSKIVAPLKSTVRHWKTTHLRIFRLERFLNDTKLSGKGKWAGPGKNLGGERILSKHIAQKLSKNQ